MPARRAHRDDLGTNQIQAIDLVVRKLVADGGRAFAAWLERGSSRCRAGTLRAGGGRNGFKPSPLARATVVTARRATMLELPFRVADDHCAPPRWR